MLAACIEVVLQHRECLLCCGLAAGGADESSEGHENVERKNVRMLSLHVYGQKVKDAVLEVDDVVFRVLVVLLLAGPLLDLLEDPEEANEVDRLLAWWNR